MCFVYFGIISYRCCGSVLIMHINGLHFWYYRAHTVVHCYSCTFAFGAEYDGGRNECILWLEVSPYLMSAICT